MTPDPTRTLGTDPAAPPSDPDLDAGLAAAFGPGATPAPNVRPPTTLDGTDTHDPQAAPGAAPAVGARYPLGDEIARGGMGVVYRASQPSVGRDVAVKVLHDRFRTDPRAVARFVAEARITAQLQHPGIPPVHEVGTLPDGSPFLVMKLIGGRTLADLIRDRPDPAHDRGRFVAVFEQIAQAVGYAHAQGIVHRDLKPHNVMVGAHGEVQVMDWGLAKVLASRASDGTGYAAHPDGAPRPADAAHPGDRRNPGVNTPGSPRPYATAAGAVLGTPAYMPPEQARGELEKIDARSDVFGLGAILCAILTGDPPYTAPNGLSARQMAAAADLDPALARLSACGADPALVALCVTCLSPEPANRPADGAAVARAVADLRAAADERARRAEVERAEAALREVEGRRRRRVQQALAAAVLLLAAGGGAFAWWHDRQSVARATEQEFNHRQARDGIAAALTLSAGLRAKYRFREADAALAQAEQLAAGAPELVGRVEQARADLAFVRELDAIRMKRGIEVGGTGTWRRAGVQVAVTEYQEAFRGHGLDVIGGDPAAVAAAVAASTVRAELVAALDDWATMHQGWDTRTRILAVLRRADPGPWLDAFRDPAVRRNRMALGLLARSADTAALRPATVTALAAILRNSVALLERASLDHPDEFLILAQLAWEYADRNEYDAAIAHYRGARAARPESLAVLNNLGNALLRKGELPAAAAVFREAIRLDPTLAHAHANLGEVLLRTGDAAGAEAALREAIRLDPGLAPVHNHIGVILYKRGDPRGAEAAYREAIRLDPEVAEFHHNLALVLHHGGDIPGAEAAYREAIRLNPDHADAHSNLGAILFSRGDRAGGVAAFREAVRSNPRMAALHNNLGFALMQTGERDAALKAFGEAIRLDPDDPKLHRCVGFILEQKQDLKGAVAAYRVAVRLDPADAGTHVRLGICLALLRDLDGAAAAYREAIRLDPGKPKAHISLGIVLFNKGDIDGAVAAYREAVRLDPTDPEYAQYLALGLKRKAERDARTAPPPRPVDR